MLPHTVARRQPASISESVVSGVACTKSQSDPAKMAPDTGRIELGEWLEFKCRVVNDFVGEARNALRETKADAELGLYMGARQYRFIHAVRNFLSATVAPGAFCQTTRTL